LAITTPMAWPKKKTHKLVVDDMSFLWHYSGHCPACSNAVITVGKSGDRYFLYVDPMPWDFEFRPAYIAEAIRWALSQGWSSDSGPTRAMALDGDCHVWLPEGFRHLYDVKSAAS